LAASILILRSFVLVLGWIYPGFITSLVITELLTAALFLNVICVDAQILCFPILDFIAAQNALTIANQKLEDLTNTDELTGLLNRRALNARLDLAFSGYSMDGRTLSVILFDIDHFKRVNDSFGHLMGDKVIRKIADLAKKQVRSNDLVMRYGGEEFLVFLPETDCSEALDIAERLRVGIAQFHFDLPELSTSFQVTASFGVADLRAEMLSMSDLLQHADIALYKAKVQGRNQVCV
jgi:diguanylate cyclase (GGDEF)-like protein